MDERLPMLRGDIQLLPAEMQGRQVLAVRDLLGLREGVVALAPEALRLLPLFDGEHTLADLQEVMMRTRGNQLVMRDEAEQVVRDLDGLLLLQTERYQEKKREVREAFAAMPARPAHLAGSGYPADPPACREMLDAILDAVDVPPAPGPVRVLVAPHIDLRAGEAVFAAAYNAIRQVHPRRLLLLGTGHATEEERFSLTDKDYDTPLGAFRTDRDAVRVLREAGGELAGKDDFAHRTEHALEFQVLFLRHLLDEDIPVVPVLFGSLNDHLASAEKPSDIPGVDAFLRALGSLVDDETLVVAGVDLSHVGPKFGHPDPAGVHEEEFREHDERLLDCLCRGSAVDFWAEGQRVEDRFHVCGFPVLACLLDALPGLNGRVLDYHVWHEPPTRSAVSFAALVLA